MPSCYQIRTQIATWAPVLTTQCDLWQDQGHSTCTDMRDEGTLSCNQYEDQGHHDCGNWGKNCCQWKPCVWVCGAFTWVCHQWYWVTKWVCVVSVWIASFVCHLWMWIANFVCIVSITLVHYVIVGFAWVVWFFCSIFSSVPRSIRCFRDTPRNPLQKPGWTLTFEDDFTTASIDPAKWTTTPYGWPTQWDPGPTYPEGPPYQWYDPAGFHYGPSTVKLLANNQVVPAGAPPSIKYTAAWLSWPQQEQRFGWFEIRCKIPDTPDMWPAFWLYSRHWGAMEIDVFEFWTRKVTGEFNSTQHWGPDKKTRKTETRRHRVCRPAKHFRIYACEWTQKEIRWYLDNRLVRIATNGIANFEFPMYVIVNSAVDGRAPDGILNHHQQDPDSSTYPNYFEVDYVRAYSR